jgi:hypothetical protein
MIIKLLDICLMHYPVGSQHKIKRRIGSMTTTEMKQALSADALDLFLNVGKVHKVCLPTYGAFFAYKKDVAYKPFEMCAARLLDWFRRTFVADQKHTGCFFSVLKQLFLAHEPGAKLYFDQAFWTLVKKNALVYNRETPDNPTVTLPSLHKHAETVCAFLSSLFGNSGEVKRRRHVAPGIPPFLTDEQTRAAWHMLHNPLTIVVGPPGRGKTSMIVWAVAAYQQAACLSFVGTNVAAHRERMGGRTEVSNTAHHFYYTCKNSDPSWGQSIDALIWDEFANVPLSLAAHTLECVPNAQRALFVLDPAQIAPLKPGHVGVDFIAAFPQHTHTLSLNLRVSANARALAEAAVHILRGEHEDRIEWSDSLEELSSITYVDAKHSFERHIRDLLRHIAEYMDFYQVYSLKDIQFIAFTREMRDMANAVIEQELAHFPNWAGCRVTSGVQVREGLFLYVGCKICVRGENFVSFRGNQYHSIRNGETGIVVSINIVPKLGPVVRLDVGHRTKTLLLNRLLHVNPSNVHLAHCITADVSQGSEYKTVIGLFHDGCAQDTWIGRSRVYVMTSRAQQAFIAFGKRVLHSFNAIASRVEPSRMSYLLPMLHKRCPEPPPIAKDASVDQMRLDTDLSQMEMYTGEDPCVPVPGK